ncbi:hypothetical protein RRG08_053820 [Elysia crispata]|uniref:Major facilitator superfamily (MFS) profile domain-containing protein n=1 Tax=Elysia crispata TaxID=231223 RepID=A0AAE1CMV3_9GAST|nr:hypothetical protein RRG08_053820 [Elysia crispata]
MAIKGEKCKKYCAILGAHFAIAPMSFLWIYGNLVAYMDSYTQFACSNKCQDADSQWILAVFVAGQYPGVFLVKPLVDKIGLRWTGVITMVISNTAVLSSAWSLQVSVAWTVALYGIFAGPCVGICASLALHVVSGWTPEWTGLFMATVSSFPTALSLLQNQMITAYVNPDNLKTDAKVGLKAYFSQPLLLDRVPRAIIMLAAMTFILQLIGYALVSNPPNLPHNTQAAAAAAEEMATVERADQVQSKKSFHGNDNGAYVCEMKNYGSSDKCEIFPEPPVLPVASEVLKHNSAQIATVHKDHPISWRPSQVILSPAFYAALLFGVTIEYSLQIKASFYKEFAQIYIHDDRYLTFIGSLEPVTSTLSRILFGALVDRRVFSLKAAMVFSLALNGVLCSLWYMVAKVSAVLYLFLLLGLSVAHSLLYVVMFCVALKLFGPDHMSTNFGLTLTFLLVGSLLTPIMVHVLLKTLGWFWLFTSCSIFSLFTLVFVAACSFDTQRQER